MGTEYVEKTCSTCLYQYRGSGKAPCDSCDPFTNWEAVQNVTPAPIEVDKRCSNCLRCDDASNDLFCPDCGEDRRWFTPRSLSVDKVNPKHYSRFKIQPSTFCVENNLSFLQGNIIKYVCRFPYKGGVMDLKKAARYLEELIARAEVDNGKSAA